MVKREKLKYELLVKPCNITTIVARRRNFLKARAMVVKEKADMLHLFDKNSLPPKCFYFVLILGHLCHGTRQEYNTLVDWLLGNCEQQND